MLNKVVTAGSLVRLLVEPGHVLIKPRPDIGFSRGYVWQNKDAYIWLSTYIEYYGIPKLEWPDIADFHVIYEVKTPLLLTNFQAPLIRLYQRN